MRTGDERRAPGGRVTSFVRRTVARAQVLRAAVRRCAEGTGVERRSAGGPPARRNIASGSPYEPVIGFSRAVRIDDRVLVSGTGPVWPDGSCPDDVEAQSRRCLEIIATALARAGATAGDVVRTRVFLTAAADADAVGRVHGEVFGDLRPAATMVVVAGLVDPRWRVEIEAEAVLGAR